MISPQTDRDPEVKSIDATTRAALRRRVEFYRVSRCFHSGKTVKSSRARCADEPELRDLFRGRGSRWRSPSRSRLVVGTTQPRRSRSARLGRLARTASKRRRKTKRNFAFSTFFRCDPRDARVDERRERVFSLVNRRRSVSESLLPKREGSSDGYSRRREGRSVLDPTTSRAARMMTHPRAMRRFSCEKRDVRRARLSRHRRLFRVSSVSLRW